MGFLNKLFGKKEKESLNQGLEKTKQGFLSRLTKVIAGKSSVDEEVLAQSFPGTHPETSQDSLRTLFHRTPTDPYNYSLVHAA